VETLEVYCDGSGEERVGRAGGWAFVVVRQGEVLLRGDGGDPKTTSLVMELEAARAALRAVLRRRWHTKHDIVLISDCSIALEIAAGRFMPKPKQYTVLASSLRELAVKARASTRWVRAHGGHVWNEEVDLRAREARLAQPGARFVQPRR
jgi:ribonuclease HI